MTMETKFAEVVQVHSVAVLYVAKKERKEMRSAFGNVQKYF